MMVRLGFAVAAHLECEILVVDEVLAVGDVEFQDKCIGKIRDIAGNSGRAVLFVSHNMTAVRTLCNRAILVKQGRVCADDLPSKVVPEYLGYQAVTTGCAVREQLEDLATGVVKTGFEKTIRVNSASIVNADGTPLSEFSSDQEVYLHINVTVYQPAPNLRCILFFKDSERQTLLISQSLDGGKLLHSFPPGKYKLRMEIPPNLFGETRILIDLHLLNPKTEHLEYEDLFNLRCTFVPNELSTYGAYETVFLRPLFPWAVSALLSEDNIEKGKN